MSLRIGNSAWPLLCLVVLLSAAEGWPREGEPRLVDTASVALGAGVEVSHGDYGVGADATVVSLPLSLYWRPHDRMDLTFEAPLLYLSSKSDSGVVVTSAGGAGRRRGAGRAGKAAAKAETVQEYGIGDVNMTAGWILAPEGEKIPKVRPTLYVKAPTGDLDRGLGTGTLEAGPGLSVSKWIGVVQLFAEGAYIFQDSRSDYAGRNYVGYLGGAGVQTTDRLFVSLLAKGSSARSEGADAQGEVRLLLNFLQSRRVLWEIYGAAGFTDASPAFGGGLMMSYQF